MKRPGLTTNVGCAIGGSADARSTPRSAPRPYFGKPTLQRWAVGGLDPLNASLRTASLTR